MKSGDKILYLRKKEKWSQAELGRRANITSACIAKIENGQRPAEKTLEKIASAFGMDVEEFENLEACNE